MSLVEAEDTGPIEGEDAIVTPPRPPHRRVSVSLLFTLTVLIGTVVAIYVRFPPRHNVLMTEAIAEYRDTSSTWDLVHPTAGELRAWVTGAVGTKSVPLAPDLLADGARRIEILNRSAAVIRYTLAGEPVTYVVQIAGSVGPDASASDDGMHAITWQTGKLRFVLVGRERAPVEAMKKLLR